MSTRNPQKKIEAMRVAAADIIISQGPDALTHRAVAAKAGVSVGTTTKYFDSLADLRRSALEFLAEEVDQDLQVLKQDLAAAEDKEAFLASSMAEILTDSQSVVRECALAFAGVFDDELREISLRWYRGLQDILATDFGPTRAEVFAQFVDGVTVHTALTGTAPSRERIYTVITALSVLKEK